MKSNIFHSDSVWVRGRFVFFSTKKNKKLAKLREETGLPLSKIIELKLKGYEIIKKENRKASNIEDSRERQLPT